MESDSRLADVPGRGVAMVLPISPEEPARPVGTFCTSKALASPLLTAWRDHETLRYEGPLKCGEGRERVSLLVQIMSISEGITRSFVTFREAS